MNTLTAPTLSDYATFCGVMDFSEYSGEKIELWNLTRPLLGYPVNSTVDRRTIEKAIATDSLHAH